MFTKELEFFVSNQEDFVKKYSNKVLVIRNQELVGVYDDALTAYLAAQKEFELGTFMIQPCINGPQAYTATISTLNFITT